jgi:hypothetical protein
MTRWLKVAAVSLTLSAACGSKTTPSPTPLNLAGTWSGTLVIPESATTGSALALTWTASQNGVNVSGPHTVTHPQTGLSFSGTLTGTLSGTNLTLTMTVPRGNVPISPTCSITGVGVMSATTTSIAGTLTTVLSQCDGFNFPANGTVPLLLTLSK